MLKNQSISQLVQYLLLSSVSNQAADALANLDLKLFATLAREMFPARQLLLCRLHVPDHWLVSDPLRVASRRHR